MFQIPAKGKWGSGDSWSAGSQPPAWPDWMGGFEIEAGGERDLGHCQPDLIVLVVDQHLLHAGGVAVQLRERLLAERVPQDDLAVLTTTARDACDQAVVGCTCKACCNYTNRAQRRGPCTNLKPYTLPSPTCKQTYTTVTSPQK